MLSKLFQFDLHSLFILQWASVLYAQIFQGELLWVLHLLRPDGMLWISNLFLTPHCPSA